MSQPALLGLAGLLGLVLGSFLNVLASRLPAMIGHDGQGPAPPGLWRPASHCPACKAPLAAWHMLPLVGFALLGGRCAGCGVGISWRYPLLELLGAVVATLAAARYGAGAAGLAAGTFGFLLLAAAAIDAETHLLPDALVLPTLWLGLVVNAFALFTPPASAILGAAVGYAMLRLVEQGYRLLRGREGLGRGDAKLAAALGAWLGWQALPWALLIAVLAGIAVGLFLLLRGRRADQPFAFGPMLAGAGFVMLLYGEGLATLYRWHWA